MSQITSGRPYLCLQFGLAQTKRVDSIVRKLGEEHSARHTCQLRRCAGRQFAHFVELCRCRHLQLASRLFTRDVQKQGHFFRQAYHDLRQCRTSFRTCTPSAVSPPVAVLPHSGHRGFSCPVGAAAPTAWGETAASSIERHGHAAHAPASLTLLKAPRPGGGASAAICTAGGITQLTAQPPQLHLL